MYALRRTLPVLLGLLLLAPAIGRGREVRDEANLFRAETRARAAEEIAQIRQLFNRDVVIETMASAPERSRVKAMRQLDEANYFAELGKQHAQDAAVNGLHILICRDPRRYIQVTVWPDSEKEFFTDEDAEKLYRLLKHRRADRALLNGLAMVRETYRRRLDVDNVGGLGRAGSIAVVMLGLVTVWLLLLLASKRLGAKPEMEPVAAGPALFATMFGQTAAWWIHDRLLLAHAGKIDRADAPAAVPAAVTAGEPPLESVKSGSESPGPPASPSLPRA